MNSLDLALGDSVDSVEDSVLGSLGFVIGANFGVDQVGYLSPLLVGGLVVVHVGPFFVTIGTFVQPRSAPCL